MGLQRARKYQTEGGARYLLGVIGHSNGEGGTPQENRKITAVKEIEGRKRQFPNTVHGITGRLCRGARLHIYRIIMYFEQLHFNILHIYAVKTPMSSIKLDFSIKTKI